jgi:hypothetical protein
MKTRLAGRGGGWHADRLQAMPAMMAVTVAVVPVVMVPPVMAMSMEARRAPVAIWPVESAIGDAVTPAVDVPARAAAPAYFGDGLGR